MRTRTLVGVSIVLLSVFHQPAAAQVDPGPEGGDWALQFQITDNFTLSEFQGSIVSVKYHSSEQSAWRAGLGFDFGSSTAEAQRTESGVPTLTTSDEFSRQTVRLDLQYLRYENPDSKVQFLFGGGPFAGLNNRSRDVVDEDGLYQSREKYDRWEAGVSGLFGVEWFVASRISLHAEYGFQFSYAQHDASSSNSASDVQVTTDTESWAFGSRDVLLGVSAYF